MIEAQEKRNGLDEGWVTLVGMSVADRMKQQEGDEISRTWSAFDRRYQKAIWKFLDEETRQRLREQRERKA